MGVSIFKNITSQQSQEFWVEQLKAINERSNFRETKEYIDYAKDIDTYNGDFSFFIIPLLRAKIHEAKRSHDLSSAQKEEIKDLIYNSNLGDFYKKSLLDDLENSISLDAVINEAKKTSYQTKAYFSTLLTVSQDDKEKLPYLRSQIALTDSALQRIAMEMLNIIQEDQYVEDISRNETF